MGVDWNSPKHQADRKRHEAWMKGFQGQPNGDSQNFGAYQMGANMRASSKSAPHGSTGGLSEEDRLLVLRWAGAVVLPLISASMMDPLWKLAYEEGSINTAKMVWLALSLAILVAGILCAKKLLDLQTQLGRSIIGWLLGLPAFIIGGLIGYRAIFRHTYKIFWDEVLVSLAFLIPGAFLLLRAVLKKKKKTGA